jgi:hypothetical protein
MENTNQMENKDVIEGWQNWMEGGIEEKTWGIMQNETK